MNSMKTYSIIAVETIGILLTISDEQKLYLKLSDSGLVHRSGDGSEQSRELDLFIGKVDSEVFETARKSLRPIVDNWIGSFRSPSIVGKECRLTIQLQSKDGTTLYSVWEYGLESQGPPPVIRDFVVEALDDTEQWYQSQLKMRDSRSHSSSKSGM